MGALGHDKGLSGGFIKFDTEHMELDAKSALLAAEVEHFSAPEPEEKGV